MKKITSILLVAITCLTSTLFAQDKFGHIHSEQLLMIMPETADADKAIQEYSQMLETQLQAMYGEYQTKAGEFQTNEGLMTDIVKEAKIKEIQDLELRIQQFQQTSQESIQQKRNEVLSPLLEKGKLYRMMNKLSLHYHLFEKGKRIGICVTFVGNFHIFSLHCSFSKQKKEKGGKDGSVFRDCP